MNMKKVIIALAFMISLFSVSAYAKTMQFTMGDYNAKVDDSVVTTLTMEVAPYTVNGRTMVPARVIGETFGADVQWIEDENRVIITLGDKTISLIIGQSVATVNGEQVALDVPSVETNGRTLVPLRFVSEALEFDVKYIASTEQILITDDEPVIEINGAKISLADFKAMYGLYTMQYGSEYSDEEITEALKLMLMNYAIYEAEADKWDIDLPVDYWEEIEAVAQEISSLMPNYLDAVWANLLEIEYRTSELSGFLYQVYTPDEAEAEKYYNENYMAAKHILVSDKATASNIKNQLNRGADFDKLMNEYSEDPGLALYPDGYWFTTGEMLEEFENTVRELKINKVSGVVETDAGYHIIKRIALPEYNDGLYQEIASKYATEAVANHFTEVADNGEVKTDAYTNAQLIALCK